MDAFEDVTDWLNSSTIMSEPVSPPFDSVVKNAEFRLSKTVADCKPAVFKAEPQQQWISISTEPQHLTVNTSRAKLRFFTL